MAIDYTVNALIDNIKRRITVPQSQNFFLPDNIVAFANDTMHSDIIPFLIGIREEFFVTNYDVQIVSGTDVYRMPSRTVAGAIRDIVLIDSNGNEVGLPRLQPEVTKSESSLSNVWLAGVIVEDDKVRLFPNSATFTQRTLRFKYIRRPNNLVVNSKAAKIVNINTGTNEVTLTNLPSTWTTSTTFDVIRPEPLFTTVQDDQAITNIAGFILTFSSLPTDLAAGQWVSEAGFSAIPQIPYEAHQTLAQFTAGRMLESQGDRKNAETIIAVANQMRDKLVDILTPRIESSPQKINNRSGIFTYTGTRWFDLGA